MSHRLYLDGSGQSDFNSGVELELNREQSHYLTRVLRLQQGSEFLCFDGQGCEWRTILLAADNKHCTIALQEKQREQTPILLPLTLGIGWLKGAAMDMVVQKATELGVDNIQVLHTERSNVQLDGKRTSNKLRHWRQIAISAAEQSNRLFIPNLPTPIGLAELLDTRAEDRRMMLDPGARLLDAGNTRQALTLLVGPEGGWTDSERNLAERQGLELCGLGNLTLRAETAPLVALSAVQHGWGWRD